jgi:trans-aconitate 2-methyltransferase
MPEWDANLYLRFGNERTQPVFDLVHRIELEHPSRIVDLGCGPGNSTEVLRRRWPHSHITGLDNSPAMIAKARASYPQENWVAGDAATWQDDRPFDLVFSNAMLHWIPDHRGVCRRLWDLVAPGGALAVQIPAHYDSPMHREILEVSRQPLWNARMEGARRALTCERPDFYDGILQPLASHLSIWETTYYHVLDGPGKILEWFRGTGLRPYLDALSDRPDEVSQFELKLLQRYELAYPRRPDGTILFPFRRLFFVAYR